MNSSHQTPFMDKSVPAWLLKNPQFMEQLKKQKEERILKEKQEQKECETSSSKANIVELD